MDREAASSPAQGVHDLHAIPFAQEMGCVLAARDDFRIDLYGDAALGQAFISQEDGERASVLDVLGAAVQLDVHPVSLPQPTAQCRSAA